MRTFKNQEPGQSLVEFALMFLILMFILMGVFDLGRAFFALVALQDVVAEGATYAAMAPACVDSGDCADPNNITFRATHESGAGLVNPSLINVSVQTFNHDISYGRPITVSATYVFPLLTPTISSIVGSNTLVLRAASSAVIH